LERLLAGGCSELSLAAGDTDLELDYYDYNVSNAGAVPGSFLGMDPQYLIWIPPFAPGRWEEDGEVLEMAARSQHKSASDSDELSDLLPKAQNGQSTARMQHQSPGDVRRDQRDVNKRYVKAIARLHSNPISDTEETTEFIPYTSREQDNERKMLGNNHYFENDGNLTARWHHRPEEKETRVEKSPSSESPEEEDDIKFVDDEDEDDDKPETGVVIMADNKQRHILKRV